MTDTEYSELIRAFLTKHRLLIRMTRWLGALRQVKLLKRVTDAPWPLVHDAMYHRNIYQDRYERLIHSSNAPREGRAVARTLDADVGQGG